MLHIPPESYSSIPALPSTCTEDSSKIKSDLQVRAAARRHLEKDGMTISPEKKRGRGRGGGKGRGRGKASKAAADEERGDTEEEPAGEGAHVLGAPVKDAEPNRKGQAKAKAKKTEEEYAADYANVAP